MRAGGDPAAGREALLRRTVEHFAANGIADTTLRSLARHVESSHRMLLYHFGSRDGLLSAVVDFVESEARAALKAAQAHGSAQDDPLAAGLAFWKAITDQALVYGPLFFELSSHAMQGMPHAMALRERLVTPWVDALAATWTALGLPRAQARTYARLDLAVARGLLHDLLISGQRRQVDAAMRHYATTMIAVRRRDGAI
jgi:AcrR family transcriptional regulator